MKKRLLSTLLALTLVLGLFPTVTPHVHGEEHTCDDGDGDACCDICGYEAHEHTYKNGEYYQDSEYHYAMCDVCGHWDGLNCDRHTDTDSNCLCDVCEYSLHQFDGVANLGDGTHQGVCTECGETVGLPHAYDFCDWDEAVHWFVCECGAADEDIGKHDHTFDYNNWYPGGEMHYPLCDVCGYHKNMGEAHVDDNNDGACDICDYWIKTGELPSLPSETTGKIIVLMADSYGDGWNGAAINIYENDVLAGTATVIFDEDDRASGYSCVFEMRYDSTAEYRFVWVIGNYDDECTYKIYVNGEECNDLDTEEGGSGGGEDDEPTAYTVTIDDSIENGTVTFADGYTSPVEPGVWFCLDITPDEGYVLDFVTVTGESGASIDFYHSDNSFLMPHENVTVTATFLEGGSGGGDGEDDEPTTYTVTITGNPVVGQTLTAVASGFDPAAELNYQWYRVAENNILIDGATERTYTLTEAELDQNIYCVVNGVESDHVGHVVAPVASVTMNGVTTICATLGEAIEAVSEAVETDAAVVELLDDIELNGGQYIESGVFTLDLNGFTINSPAGVFAIYGGTVVFTDTSESKTGAIIGRGEAIYVSGGTVTIQGGRFYAAPLEQTGLHFHAVFVASGFLNIEGGSIECEADGVRAIGGEVTITGGSITGGTYDIGTNKVYGTAVIRLALTEGAETGAVFPGGIEFDSALQDILGDGVACWQDGKRITLSENQSTITGGDVVIRASCTHIGNTNTDDGDCTTAVVCSECGTVTVPAKENHTPGADDGDCTTAVKCTACEKDAIPATGGHSYTAEFDWTTDCSSATVTASCCVCEDKQTLNCEISSQWDAEADTLTFTATAEEGAYTDTQTIQLAVVGGKLTVTNSAAEAGEKVDMIIMVAGYTGGKMNGCQIIDSVTDVTEETLTVSGDTIKVFFLETGTYAPLFACAEL